MHGQRSGSRNTYIHHPWRGVPVARGRLDTVSWFALHDTGRRPIGRSTWQLTSSVRSGSPQSTIHRQELNSVWNQESGWRKTEPGPGVRAFSEPCSLTSQSIGYKFPEEKLGMASRKRKKKRHLDHDTSCNASGRSESNTTVVSNLQTQVTSYKTSTPSSERVNVVALHVGLHSCIAPHGPSLCFRTAPVSSSFRGALVCARVKLRKQGDGPDREILREGCR